MTRLIVFGATGATGRHVVQHALDNNQLVRAYVRSPHKLPDDIRRHANLEIVQGDFSETDKIRAAIEGVDAVVITAGNPAASKRALFMVELVRGVVAGMREHGVKRLVFQAGASTPQPGVPDPLFNRLVVGPMLWLTGWSGAVRDNNAVVSWLHSEAQDLAWTVVRPGMIHHKPTKGEVIASDSMSGAVTFVDLAKFNLDTATSDAHVHGMPWVAYAA